MGVLRKIAKEMEKLEHRTETVTDQSELHRMIDEAMTNVRKLVNDGLQKAAEDAGTSSKASPPSSASLSTVESPSTTTAVPTGSRADSIVITPEGIERLETIVHSLRSNTKEIGLPGQCCCGSNDHRSRRMVELATKLAKVATGNADRLEFLINEAKGLVTPGMYPTPDSGLSDSTTSTPPSSETKSSGSTTESTPRSTRSSSLGSTYEMAMTRNLAEPLRGVLIGLERLRLAMPNDRSDRHLIQVSEAIKESVDALMDPEAVAGHFMNIDVTVDEDIYKLWEQISWHIQSEANEDCWGDAQRIHLTEVCEETLDALASAGGSKEQAQQLLMKAISEPDFDKTEKVVINAKAPWLKDPERVDLKERIRVGKKHGGKNIFTTIKEAEAFLECSKEITALAQHLDWDETQTPLQYLNDQVRYKANALNKALTHLLRIREAFGMESCPDEMIVEEAKAIVAQLAETMKKNEHVLKIIYRVRSEEQDRLDELTSLGYEALDSQDRQLVTEQDGVLIGIERVLKALGDKPTIAEEEERKIFKTTIELAAEKAAKKAMTKEMIDNPTPCTQPEMREMRKLLAFIAGAFRYVQVADGGLGSVKRLTDYAKKIGLIG